MGILNRLLGRRPSAKSVDAPYITHDGQFAVDAVGESHYQDALDAVCGGKTEDGHERRCHAALVREPRNEYDSNAISIQIDGKKVGHLGRDDAKAYAKVFDSTKTPVVAVDAMIRGGWNRGGGDTGHYGVVLDLPSPAELRKDLK